MMILCATTAMAWDNTQTGRQNQIVDSPNSQAQQQTARGGNARSTSSSTGGSGGNVSGISVSNGQSGNGVFLSIPDGRGEAPCGGGIGLGGGGSNAGGGVGGTLWEFRDCKIMREANTLDRMGYHQAAINELCQIDRIREAFGGSCPHPETVIDVDAGKRDYCFTRNAGDLNQHRECDRLRAIK